MCDSKLCLQERELREQVRKERDKEIEMVISRLEQDTHSSRDEAERLAENRVKRIRDKYEAEMQELERQVRTSSSCLALVTSFTILSLFCSGKTDNREIQ